MSTSNTNRDLKKDGKGVRTTTPKTERFRGSPQRVYDLWKSYRDRDPQKDKREAILRAYHNQPYRVTPAQRTQCLLEQPCRTNFGILAFKVNNAKTAFMDMVNEREFAFKISPDEAAEANRVNDATAADNEPPTASSSTGFKASSVARSTIGNEISYAFERYFIRNWSGYLLNMELDVLDMLLFGKGIEHFPSADCSYSENVPVDRVHPNPEAGILPEKWDSCAMEVEITWRQLWKKVRTESAARKAGWNRDAVLDLMRREEPEFADYSQDQLVKAWEDGTGMTSDIENRVAYLVEFYAMEYEKGPGGNQLSRYVIPQAGVDLEDSATPKSSKSEKDSDESGGGVHFLLEKPFYAKDMTQVFKCIVDSVGHGKYYNTPSFAESIYVASKTYDQKMGRVIDATEINSMLMTGGGDANAGKNLSKYRIHDRIHFPPGTELVQHRFNLPTKDSLDVLRQVMVDMNRGIGSYEMMQVNAAGGKTPASATQVELDASMSSKIQGSALKRFNAQLTKLGREWYRRFVTKGSNEMTEEHESFVKFKAYLESRGIAEAQWQPDAVFVESNMVLGAGSTTAKMRSNAAVIELLNMVPRNEGMKTAIREGVGILKGVGNLEHYFPPEDELEYPSTEDWRIGQENEAMKSNSFKDHNAIVVASDNHLQHLFGSGDQNVPPVGHIQDAGLSLQEGLGMLEALAQTPESDQVVLMDKIAEVLREVTSKSQHCKVHMVHLNQDPSKKQFAQQAQAQVAQIDRGIAELANNLAEAQQARMRRMAEEAQRAQDQQAEMQAEMARLQMDAEKHQQDMAQKQQKFSQDFRHKEEKHEVETSTKVAKTMGDAALADQKAEDQRRLQALQSLQTTSANGSQ